MVTNKTNKKQNITAFIVGGIVTYLAITKIEFVKDKVLDDLRRKEEKRVEAEDNR